MEPIGPTPEAASDPAASGSGPRERRLLGAGLAVGAAAIALVLVACAYVPFQDLPNHIKVLAIDAELRRTGGTKFLIPSPGLAFGYTFVTLVARVLGPIVGPAQVVRGLCIAGALAMPASAWRLARATRSEPLWAAFLSLPLALSWPLRVGMIEYALGLPFVVLGLALAIEAVKERTARSIGWLALCGVACYLAHPYAFVWLALLSLVATIALGGVDGRALRSVALGLLAAAPLAAWDLAHHRMDMVQGADATLMRSPTTWRPFNVAFAHVVTRGLGITGPTALGFYVPLLLVLGVACTLAVRSLAGDADRRLKGSLVAAATLASVGTVLLPDSRENVFLIGSRPIVLGVLCWAVVAGGAVPRRAWLRGLAVAAVALALGFQLAEVRERARLVTSVVGESGPALVEGAYLPLQVPRCSAASSIAWGDYDPLRHVWAYALGTGGVAPYLFAGSRYQPVWFREDALKEDLNGPNDHLLTGNEAWHDATACSAVAQDRLKAATAWRGAYAGVLVTGRQPEVAEEIARAGRTIERQLAPGMYVVERGGAGPTLSIDFGTLHGTAAEYSGFYPGEVIDGRNAQWSRGTSSVVRFALSEIHDEYMLRVLSKAPSPLAVGVVVNGTYRTTLDIGAEMSSAAVRVPGSALKAGANELAFEYPETFTPRERGEARQLAVLYYSLSLRPLAAGVTVDIGTPWGKHMLGDGFSPGETIDQRRAAWSEGKSSLVWLDVTGGAPGYVLTLRAKAYVAQTVHAIFEGGWTDSVKVGETWSDWQLYVPGDAVHPGRNALRLTYEKPTRPTDVGGSEEGRELALAFDAVSLEPTPSSLQADLGSPNAHATLRAGFGNAESINGESAAWSLGKSSEVEFIVNGDPGAYVLALRALGHGEQRTTVSCNDGPKTVLTVAPAWADYTVAIPAGVLRAGRNVLRFEYESPGAPGGKDTRLLGIALRLIDVVPVTPDVRLDIGRPSARAALTGGFSDVDEVIGQRSAVWAVGPRADLAIQVAPSTFGEKPEVELGFTATTLQALAPERVEIFLNDRSLGTVDVRKGWGTYAVSVPTGQLLPGSNAVRLQFARVAQPADFGPQSTETRPLTVALDELWIR